MVIEESRLLTRTDRGPLANLKREIGFTSGTKTLKPYMQIADVNMIPPQQLLYFSSEMAMYADDHPFIGHASAWAAAGAALHRSTTFEYAEIDRFQALELARSMWQNTEKRFEKASYDAEGERKARLLDLGFRATEALACLPTMYLVARWFNGSEVPKKDIVTANAQTKNYLVSLLCKLKENIGLDEELDKRIKNLRHEILTIVLPQEDPNHQVVLYPSSLQQDHNTDPGLRADLVVVDTGFEHKRGLVQVTADPNKKKLATKNRVFIYPHKDLVLNGKTTSATQEAFVARENGTLYDVNSSDGLLSISTILSDRMYDFLRGTLRSQTPVFQASFAHR